MAELLIRNLDEHGFHEEPPETLVKTEADRRLLAPAMVLVQGFDPVGTCVKDVRESLEVQIRRHPDARWRLKVSDLAVMAALQRTILREAAQAVAPGGLLIYSTCSLEPEENDAQVESFLAERPEWRLEPPEPGVVPHEVLDAGRLRTLPHRHGIDGAFAARLRRTAA